MNNRDMLSDSADLIAASIQIIHILYIDISRLQKDVDKRQKEMAEEVLHEKRRAYGDAEELMKKLRMNLDPTKNIYEVVRAGLSESL